MRRRSGLTTSQVFRALLWTGLGKWLGPAPSGSERVDEFEIAWSWVVAECMGEVFLLVACFLFGEYANLEMDRA